MSGEEAGCGINSYPFRSTAPIAPLKYGPVAVKHL